MYVVVKLKSERVLINSFIFAITLLTALASAAIKMLLFGMDMGFVRCENEDKIFVDSIFFHFKKIDMSQTSNVY